MDIYNWSMMRIKKVGSGLTGKRLLLMGSSAFRADKLPAVLEEKIDQAISGKMSIVVGEAHGACRFFQDYLKTKNYPKVVVGHAKTIRYNAGSWKTLKYGNDVPEREKNMILECDSAVIIWTDKSGVIANNLELLKRLRKPTFLYECSTRSTKTRSGWLDPKRIFDPYYNWKEYMRRKKDQRVRCGRRPQNEKAH
jgi:hypothetical protein